MFGLDRRTDGQMDTSSPLLTHFRSTSLILKVTLSKTTPLNVGTISQICTFLVDSNFSAVHLCLRSDYSVGPNTTLWHIHSRYDG